MEWLLFLSVLFQQVSTVAGMTEVIIQDIRHTVLDKHTYRRDLSGPDKSLWTDLSVKWISVVMSVASSVAILVVFYHVRGHRKVDPTRFIGTPLTYLALPHGALLAMLARILLRVTSMVETQTYDLGFQDYCIASAFMFNFISELCLVGLFVKLYVQPIGKNGHTTKHQLHTAYGLVEDDTCLLLPDEKLIIA